MPFKLKLRKTRQYNVASKNLFVISVELLDGGIADCTLSVDSTGQECLDNVCQRQAINQPEFFGLRYISRSQQPRWVQLDRPLKSQLDKYSSSHLLYLRVMYYVISGTSLITDEVTRYHYFLQLKNDLIEGRIICDCQQAVVLAAYSRQAEYGNHDQERHTVDYLKNLLTFPKQMIDGGQIIDGSALAETERLEWLTSAVIQHHISLHNMSQAQAEEGFITACQQLRGYGQEMFTAVDQIKQNEVTIAVSLTGIMVLSETSDTPSFYRWTDITNVINHKRTFSVECTSGTVESASFKLPTPEDGKYVWRLCVLQHTFYMRHQRALIDNHHAQPQPKFQEHGLSESREQLDVVPSRANERPEPLSPSHRAHSTSCLDLDQHQQHQGVPRALLPQYRPAPDYETAIQQKYQQQRAEAQMRFQNHPHTSVVNTIKPIVYGSHPDIHRIHYPDVTRHTLSLNQAVDPDFYGLNYVSHNSYTPFAVNPNVQTELNPQMHYVNVYKPPPPYPSGLASNSTPDLALASQAYHRGYINSHVSGSSPDLVSNRTALNRQYLGLINGVNVVNYGRHNLLPHSASTHGTFNNLSSVIDNPHIILDPHHGGESKVLYPINRTYQRHIVMPQTQLKSHEPIYENVPLPWQNENNGIRNRAQSLTTQDELSRHNGRNSSHPIINQHGNLNNHTQIPKITIDSDSHYVNAQIIKGVRESSVPKDMSSSNRSLTKEVSISNRSINKEVDNATQSIERISISKDDDETPYTSLSTTKINKIESNPDHVTSITVPDMKTSDHNSNISNVDSAFSNSLVNSTYSTSIHLDSSNDKSSVGSKEKKRRRWGVFIGKGKSEEKSATLGRDRGKNSQPANKHRWSTGLPKSQPLPPSITKENMCQLLERKMSEMELSFAFELIPKSRENADYTTALLPENAYINGYSSDNLVLPYEDNRVRLQPTPDNRHGYINASHITMTVGSSQRFYVVMKGNFTPLPRLVGDRRGGNVQGGKGEGGDAGGLLWAAVGQLGAGVVAVLHPGELYFMPPSTQTRLYGQWSVHVTSSVDTGWGVISRVEVTRKEPDRRDLNRRELNRKEVNRKELNRKGSAESRGVWVLHYKAWTDQQLLPDVNQFLDFLRELSTLESGGGGGGWGVSAAPLAVVGVRGAGAAVAGDLLLHILDNNQELDIPRTIRLLHLQRANLIQNVHQYRFLHQILLHYLKQTSTAMSGSPVANK